MAGDTRRRPPDSDWLRLSPVRALSALAADWLILVASFAGAIVFHSAPIYLLAAILVGRTQLALAIMMHESAHGVLFRRRRVNDVVGQVLAAAPFRAVPASVWWLGAG